MVQVIKLDPIKQGNITKKPALLVGSPGGNIIIPHDEITPTAEAMLKAYLENEGVS